MRLIDLTGKQFGRLLVVRRASTNTTSGHPKWDCLCECGTESLVVGLDLRTGHTTSCGCFNREVVVKMRTKHGACDTGAYRSWMAMLNRCRNPAATDYAYYGGRGISVCDRWHNFSNFLEDMGERPVEMTLDRKNVNGNYEPGNCRWATRSEQMQNTRRSKLNGATNAN